SQAPRLPPSDPRNGPPASGLAVGLEHELQAWPQPEPGLQAPMVDHGPDVAHAPDVARPPAHRVVDQIEDHHRPPEDPEHVHPGHQAEETADRHDDLQRPLGYQPQEEKLEHDDRDDERRDPWRVAQPEPAGIATKLQPIEGAEPGRAGARRHSPIGSRIVTVVPMPSVLVSTTRPPCCSTISRTLASPMPLPSA